MQFCVLVTTLLLSSLALCQTTGQLGDAPATTTNPAGVSYQALLLDKNTTTLRGTITGTSGANGVGVDFNVNFTGFPDASLGPFIYHIHEAPISADGNCTTALAHLDPFMRGETPACNASEPQTCQVGDLSGKHGQITNTTSFHVTYTDLYTTTQAGQGAFFGNRSIVVHSANKTRLNCANFTLAGYGYGYGDGNSSGNSGNGTVTVTGINGTNGSLPTSSSSPPSHATSVLPTFSGNAASTNVLSLSVVLLGVLSFAL